MKLFVTSGNTWVKIDPVRVVTNIFTGETGLKIANFFAEKKETVILSGSNHYLFDLKGNKQISYRFYQYFEELDETIKNVIREEAPNLIIHAAAVSDYQPQETAKEKIKSNFDSLDMGVWVPTKKLIHSIRREYGYRGLLVQFKLETTDTDDALIQIARKSLLNNQSNLCIANRMGAMQDVIAVTETEAVKIPRANLNEFLWNWSNKHL